MTLNNSTKRRIVSVREVKPLPYPERIPEQFAVGAEAWISWNGKKALPVIVTEVKEQHYGVRFERYSKSSGGWIYTLGTTTTHNLFLDEVRSTPELACINRVTL